MSLDPESLTSCPLPIREHDTVQLSHGSGGRMTNDLIRDLFVWAFDNPLLRRQDDQAILDQLDGRLAFSTDSFVVDPIFFPGGDIGDLAVNGTVNDVAMSGATPLYLSAGFVIEEGLPLTDLRTVVLSMKRAAASAGVSIVTGDTKVVNRGKADKLFINTTGLGVIRHPYTIGASQLKDGDAIIISGTIADHGVAVMSKREGLSFETDIVSDTVALNSLVDEIISAGAQSVHALRDPTRGGVAATLNEWTEQSNVAIDLDEQALPIRAGVAGACEILGFDPLYVANEGKVVVAVAADAVDQVLSAMKRHPVGTNAAVIGRACSAGRPIVTMTTGIGGRRIVDMPVGEQLPRIC